MAHLLALLVGVNWLSPKGDDRVATIGRRAMIQTNRAGHFTRSLNPGVTQGWKPSSDP